MEVLAPRRRSRARIALCGATLVSGINVSVLNVALADIARDLDATIGDLQWIVGAYTLMNAALLLSAATLGDRIGRRKVFQFGLVGGAVGCLAAAFATTPLQLIVCRAVIGGAVARVV